MIRWLMKPTLEDPPSLEAILNHPAGTVWRPVVAWA